APALIHVSVRSAVAPHVERIVAGPEEDVAQAAAALARLGPLWRTSELVSLYQDHGDRRVRARLSAAHRELTGRTIEETGLPWD
ncbi:MAG: hypothetical protein KC420_23150, partial [Myxococcales bacterium]|nr:hypothetical protein [Myxococcales bacterium]